MNKANLRMLAQAAISDEAISEKVMEYTLKKMSRQDMRNFLFYLKREVLNRKVFVRTANTPDKETVKRIEEMFKDKNVEMNFSVKDSIGAGIEIEYRDHLVELSLKGLIERTFDQIKGSL
jgi:F0F1-type ATP synthase delta subunit